MKLHCPIDHTREARPAPAAHNVAKTALQIACFWGFFLVLVPAAIFWLEQPPPGRFPPGYALAPKPWLAIAPNFSAPWLSAVAVVMFCLLGLVGIYCGMIFALLGKGTPLPLDTTTKLVIVGPYRHVRNPMAMTGTLQGVAVGMYLGSPLVVLYSVAGMLAWNLFARRWEEADLERRFGAPYAEYKRSIRCWLPRLKPYPRLDAGD